jgi:hypothetical protein
VEKWQGDAPLNASQKVAFGIIKEAATYFEEGSPPHVAFPSWHDEVRLRRLDYNLEESGIVLPLRLGELLHGLPDAGIAASLRAADIAGVGVRKWLRNPFLVVRPVTEWPDEVLNARLAGSCEEDWFVTEVLLWSFGMAKVSEENPSFTVRGQKVMGSSFAIQKKGIPGIGQTRVSRLFFNLFPVNKFLVLPSEDLRSLTPSKGGVGLTLPLPLALPDLRARFDGIVMVSDGSEDGGGAFVSCGLAEGKSGLGAAATSMAAEYRLGPDAKALRSVKVLIISLCDGFGVIRVAMERLGVRVVGFVTSEISMAAGRLMRERCPGFSVGRHSSL